MVCQTLVAILLTLSCQTTLDSNQESERLVSAPSTKSEKSKRQSFMMSTAKAVAMFETRLQRNPSDFRSASILGRLYLRRAKENDDFNDYLKAEATLKSAIKANPNQHDLKTFLAESLIAQHRFAEARTLATEVLETKPKNWVLPLATLGDAELQLGNYESAESAFARLLEQSRAASVLVRMARLRELQGDTVQAASLIREALGQQVASHGDPTREAWYHWRLAKIHLQTGRLKQAQPLLEQALKLSPNDVASIT